MTQHSEQTAQSECCKPSSPRWDFEHLPLGTVELHKMQSSTLPQLVRNSHEIS